MKSLTGAGIMVITIIGIIGIVFGIIFIAQGGSSLKKIAADLDPLPIAEVNNKYESVKASHNAIKAAEEPKIQAGQAAPSAMYNYLSAQRASLGLAKSNIGLASLVKTIGAIAIILGAGFIITGVCLYKNKR